MEKLRALIKKIKTVCNKEIRISDIKAIKNNPSLKRLFDDCKREINTIKKIFAPSKIKIGFATNYNAGIDAYNKGDYQEAVKFFNVATKAPSAKPEGYYNLGLASHKIKNYEDAIVNYQEFLKFKPEDYDATYNLGLSYFEDSKYAKASQMFAHCFELKQTLESAKMLAFSYLVQEKDDKILEFCDGLFGDFEKNKPTIIAVAKTIEDRNKAQKGSEFIDRAIKIYERILDISEKDIDALLAISICNAKKASWDSAVEYCLKALAIDENSYDANNQMGLIYYCNGKFDDAIVYYELAMKNNKNEEHKIYSNLAYAYEKQGRTPKAINLFEKMLKNFPNISSKEKIKQHINELKKI